MSGVCLPAGKAQFTNLSGTSDSSENSVSYLWDFGDGQTSSEKNPVHSYKTADSVKVILKATSVYGCVKDTAKVLANIYAQPHADFTTDPVQLCVSDSVKFVDVSIAPKSSVNSWFWSFGDGIISNVQNPVKKYTASGSYIVSLYVTSAAGCVSDTIQKTVTVNKSPTAAFTVSASACEKQPVTINNQSSTESGTITNWYWLFGDGTTANNQNGNPFSKSYDNSGIYTVKLAVQSDNGCKSDTTQQTITVVSSPVTNFILPEICVNDPAATFIGSSYILEGSGSSLTYNWNFGDQNANASNPNTSTAQNPDHQFSAPGPYNISLTATSDAGCSSTLTKPFVVNGIPTVDFTVIDSATLCSNMRVQIQNGSSVSPGSITRIEIIWDSDNAPTTIVTDNEPSAGKIYFHTYRSLQTTQVFKVNLRAYSGTNCWDEKVIPITVKPSPKVTFSPVPGICLNDTAYTITQASETTGLHGTFVF
ncbi:MAG: PKD domain-containing protein [Segetibacter sp.]